MSHSLDRVTALSSAFSLPASCPKGARIALVNIMDNACSTENHFVRTIKKADPDADITLCRMACAKLDKKYFKESEHLLSDRYVDWHDVIGRDDFDLVIVTGIDRGTLSYDVLARDYTDFWDEAKELFRAIQSSVNHGKTGHSALVCWSAFAAMKELYGVEKGIHPTKFYGLFPHTIQDPRHALLNGFEDSEILVPQSRSSYMDDADLRNAINEHTGRVVMNGPDGPAVWTLENDRMTCFINHLEYGVKTLHNEYERDLDKNNGNFPAPQNYEYVVDGDNSALEATFDTLKESCAHFYKNLISMAKQQKGIADNLEQKQNIATVQIAEPARASHLIFG